MFVSMATLTEVKQSDVLRLITLTVLFKSLLLFIDIQCPKGHHIFSLPLNEWSVVAVFQAIKSQTILNCMCHGVTGACIVKTCWTTMASFGAIGSYLRHKYDKGVLVTVDQTDHDLVVADGKYLSRPARDDLVFLEESPDYCHPNPNTGSLGTSGRVCENLNKSASGHGSCGILCCGRGFNTFRIVEEYRCRCKFNWCCDVKCKTCRRTVERRVCKSLEEYIASNNNTLPELFITTIDSYEKNRPRSKTGRVKKLRRARKNKNRGALSQSIDDEDWRSKSS